MPAVDIVVRGEPVRADVRDETRTPPLDERAFQAVYASLARPLWSYLYRVLGGPTDADDALQEVFLRYVQAPLATTDEKQVRAYLYRIASNLAIDHLRRTARQARRVSGEEPPAEVAGDTGMGERLALRRDMANTFRELTPQNRVLLWLAYVEGSSHGEIAEALRLKKTSVPVLLFRARRRLATLLKGKGWEE